MSLTQEIEEYQKAYKFTDTDLATIWRISSAQVGRIKRGERKAGRQVLRAVIWETPELWGAFIRDLIYEDRRWKPS
jgi:hypothetical protein